MRTRSWLVAALLFGSGFCALVYQVAWLRDFRLIFGASTAASAAVLAIFIGGLGVGGLLLGPRADRDPRPLLLYAQLELIVAVSAAATPLLLLAVRYLYLASGGSTTLGTTTATIARVVLSTLVLAIPTIAMGGTLPAAARAATRQNDERRQDVAAVYALNTLGAVLGCLAATFWLLETFGTRATIWLAAAVNVGVGLTAWLIARTLGAERAGEAGGAGQAEWAGEVGLAGEAGQAEEAAPASHAAQPGDGGRKAARRRRHQAAQHAPQPLAPSPVPSPQPPAHGAPEWFLLVSAAFVGFAFFLMELVWYRLLAPLLGGSVFTFGLVLAVALAGIGIGGLAYALRSGDKPASLSGFGWTCLLEACAVACTFALGDRIAYLALTLVPLELTSFNARIVGWSMVTALVVLAPALVAGYQFPLLIALFGRARDRIGQQIGRAYAANTFGAIAGSLAGGFGLLPWLSATGAWRVVAIMLLVLGAAAAILSLVNKGRSEGASLEVPPERLAGVPMRLFGQALVAVLTIVFVSSTGPTAAWRHSGIGAGRSSASQVFVSRNGFLDWMTAHQRSVIWEGDGTESGVALVNSRTGYVFIVNGKADGSARADAGTQVMSALIGPIVNPNVRRALVIGLGTGSTAGWLGAIPAMERVDVVELEPLILEVARACAAVNQNVLDNPKVHITIGDARETLLTSRDRYDLIASEPSNPYRAGIASLFTQEYYRAAADRLTDDGMFVQWVQAYEIDTPTLRTIYATLGSVFPQVETWHTNPGDIVLVASKRPRTYRTEDLARRIAEEPFKSALANVWRAVDVRGLLAHYIGNDAFTRKIIAAGADLNTDDRNLIEFRLARSVGILLATVADIRNQARMAGVARPPLQDEATVQWPAVDTAWLAYTAAMGSFIDTRPQGPPAEQARQNAMVEYFRDNDLDTARALWEQQPEPARDPTEMAMLADITANTGFEGAITFIDRLRAYQPGEADVMLASLRLRQARIGDAVAALEAALTRFRTDPWPMTRYTEQVLQLAGILANRDAATARRIYDALSQPFSVRAGEETRLVTRAQLSKLVDFPGLCGEAIGALEPKVPWAPGFLRLRRDCYQATNSPLLPVATRELDEFLANAAEPLITGP